MQYTSHLRTWQLHNQPVIVRADLNVPVDDCTILDTTKLELVQPTLDYLIEQQCTIALITHIGRPKKVDPSCSTILLVPWFTQKGYNVVHAPTISDAQQLMHTAPTGTIVLCENIRFFDGEITNSASLAQELKKLGHWYVNDAFESLHRKHASLVALAELFDHNHKTLGLTAVRELDELRTVAQHIQQPYTLIIGGKKVATKLPALRLLLDKTETIILCPAFAFTLLSAQGVAVGDSYVDHEALQDMRDFFAEAQNKHVTLITPVDIQISQHGFDGPYAVVNIDAIPANAVGISIGPKTVETIQRYITNAKTIIYNGSIGFLDKPQTLEGMHIILQAMAASTAFSILAGGDSIAVADTFDLCDSFNYCTTGGGVTLAYLSGQPLPALDALHV